MQPNLQLGISYSMPREKGKNIIVMLKLMNRHFFLSVNKCVKMKTMRKKSRKWTFSIATSTAGLPCSFQRVMMYDCMQKFPTVMKRGLRLNYSKLHNFIPENCVKWTKSQCRSDPWLTWLWQDGKHQWEVLNPQKAISFNNKKER